VSKLVLWQTVQSERVAWLMWQRARPGAWFTRLSFNDKIHSWREHEIAADTVKAIALEVEAAKIRAVLAKLSKFHMRALRRSHRLTQPTVNSKRKQS
jgi:hypothetical protein